MGRLERLEVCGLTYFYPGSGRGIEGVNLHLVRGSFTVVAGEHGAGKSTLLRALLGLLPGAGGEVRWNGVPVAGVPVAGMPAADAPVGGVRRFFAPPRSIYLAQAHAGDAPAVRVEMARLLESEAELLLVDDLSAALSAEEERLWWDALFSARLFRREGTCLAVSNRQAALSRADCILVLQQGRVVGEGRLEALLCRFGERRPAAAGVTLTRGSPRSPHPRPHPAYAGVG